MNVDNQLLLHVNAGHTPPDDVLQRILTQFKPNVVGACVQNTMELKDKTTRPDLAIIREDASGISVDNLKEMFTNAKEWPITAYFGSLKQNYKPEDIQPFVLTDGDNNAFLSLFVEGTLVGHDDPAEHTEHYNYVNGILIPKMLEWCNDFADSEDIVAKINAKLQSDLFKREFMMNVGHRAHLTIIPIEGDPVTHAKNDLGAIEDWGWITQKIEAKEEKKPEAAPAKKFSFGFGKKATASVPASPAKENPPGVHTVGKPPALPENVESGKKDNGYPAKKESADLAARPPHWVKHNDDLKLWYKIVGGEIHQQWKRRLPIKVVDLEATKFTDLAAFKTYALAKTVAAGGKVETGTSAGKPPAATAKGDAKVLEAAATGVLTPKSVDNLLEYIAKHLDTASKDIVAPKEIQSMEAALPKFSECVGLKRDEMINWPIAALKKIGEDDINALLCYAIEWRAAYRALKTGQQETKTTVVETEKVVTTTQKTGDTVKVESVSKEAAPAKKSRFSFGKAA